MRLRDLLRPLVDRAPFGLGERARHVRRIARRYWMHRHTDAYLVSFPGCGRTWLSLLIGKVLVDELAPGADPGDLVELGRKHARAGVPRIRQVHDGDPQLKRADELERDKSRFADKIVILLVRDPRDAAISYYFEGKKRRGRATTATPGEFLRGPVGGIDTVIAYYNIWAENRGVPKRFCLVRYEDLKRDPVGELAKVMAALGRNPDRAVLEAAVEFAKFDNMRKLEEQGTGHRALRRTAATGAAAGDNDAFKTRKGKVGGYREYLSADELADIDARIADRLSPMLADYARKPDAP
jgi:hypothetical protein